MVQTIDLTPKVRQGIERAGQLSLDPIEWRVRIRESGAPGTSGKETVETAKASDEETELSATLLDVLERRGEAGDARWVHIEFIATGSSSPFFSFTVQIRAPEEVIEPTEGAAMSALAQMGIRSNRLLFDLVQTLLGAMTESRMNEMKAAVLMAELKGMAEAGDDSVRWEAAKSAVENLSPAAATAAAALYEMEKRKAAEAAERAAEATMRAEEARAAAAAAEEDDNS